MIDHFKTMGKFILERDGFYSTGDEMEQKRLFLKHHLLIPTPKKNGIKNAICINFDTQNQIFRFSLDKELTKENRDLLFAMKVGAPNDCKKFLATNNFESLLTVTFPGSLVYLNKMRTEKDSKEWFARNVPEAYDSLIKKIVNLFFNTEKGTAEEETNFIDEARMDPEQLSIFSGIKISLEEKRKNKEKPLSILDIYKTFLLEIFRDSTSKELPSIYIAKIDGCHILEYEDPEIRKAYINMAYYDLYYRFIVENAAKKKYCHVCSTEKDVIGTVSLPMKFYGTTNPLYFENVKKKNSYKSFAICDDCMAPIMTGMKYTESNLGDYLLEIPCYLIPNLDDTDLYFEKKLEAAIKLLKHSGSTYSEDIDLIKKLIKQSTSNKNKSFSFNLLFYFSEQAAFNILKYIPGVELFDLVRKLNLFDEFTRIYHLDTIGEYRNALSLVDMRFALFPSNSSHINPDFKIFGKGLLSFLEQFLSNYKMSYTELISRFTDIFSRRFHKKKTDWLSPFKMICYLTLLSKLNLLKEENGMNEQHSITEVLKKEYTDFFNTHTSVYGNNSYRQGLFLLGTLISKIVYEQKKKGEARKDSSTFLAKINYDGIPARRIDKLVNEVKKYSMIYPIYIEPETWGNITDRLQGIDSSSLRPDEIVFYVLSGISFQDYLGFKFAAEKRAERAENPVTVTNNNQL